MPGIGAAPTRGLELELTQYGGSGQFMVQPFVFDGREVAQRRVAAWHRSATLAHAARVVGSRQKGGVFGCDFGFDDGRDLGSTAGKTSFTLPDHGSQTPNQRSVDSQLTGVDDESIDVRTPRHIQAIATSIN
jgi:hypothetical protein